jgi:hypothetical protein
MNRAPDLGRREKGLDGLLGPWHTVGLPAQIREFDPHPGVVLRFENKVPDLEDALPHVNVCLTPERSANNVSLINI